MSGLLGALIALSGGSKEITHRAICCSRSWILARFDTFVGFGFGTDGGGSESFCCNISISHFQKTPNDSYSAKPI